LFKPEVAARATDRPAAATVTEVSEARALIPVPVTERPPEGSATAVMTPFETDTPDEPV
jgi:hypothetical protein